MWGNFRCLAKNFLHPAKCFTQQERNTWILKRLHPPKLSKLTSPKLRKFRRKNFYYEVVANTDHVKKPLLDLVLVQDVPGVGSKGEKVEMNMYIAYSTLLLPKLAIYANLPEAQEIMKKQDEKTFSSVHCKSVEKYLSVLPLPITLSADTEWTLEQWHVKLALRSVGVLTKDECITIPKKITGPNPDIENRDFLVQLTMNKSEKFTLRCRIYHWSSANPLLNKKAIDVRSPSEPLFPDEKEKIDEIIKYEEEIRRKKMMGEIE